MIIIMYDNENDNDNNNDNDIIAHSYNPTRVILLLMQNDCYDRFLRSEIYQTYATSKNSKDANISHGMDPTCCEALLHALPMFASVFVLIAITIWYPFEL